MSDQEATIAAIIREALTAELSRLQFDCWMSKKEAAQYLRISISTLESLMRRKDQIPYTKRAGRPRFRKSQIDDWMEGKSMSIKEVMKIAAERIA